MNHMSQSSSTRINSSMTYMKERIKDEDELKLKMQQQTQQQQTLEDIDANKSDDEVLKSIEDAPVTDEAAGTPITENPTEEDNDDNESTIPHAQEELTKAEASTASPYKILHALPGYTLGDTLRQEDMMIVHSKEASAFARNRVMAGDCAFILR